MPFNSTLFLFAFLPIALAGFLALARWGRAPHALGFLLAASVFFYAWEQPRFVLLLLGSLLANFALGLAIQAAPGASARRAWFVTGTLLNLLGLAVFKYAGALPAVASHFDPGLPLAISFFTLQQIAYLSDTEQGRVRERRLLHYALFVAFFPKLVAGPIVAHDEMMGQLDAAPARRDVGRDVAVGLTLFAMGLFKKVVLADAVAGRTEGLFDVAAAGVALTCLEAWAAAIGFLLQVYFDFSGYSDMAIGLSRCFGITLPQNFHSPLKAENIAEFWRRWHITLTRWLQRFLFVPISRGIMRRGGPRWDGLAVVVAQVVTMGLCGLWHGAAASFIAWGLLHGALLALHHGWEIAKRRLGLRGRVPAAVRVPLARVAMAGVLAATFVVFRAADLGVAARMLEAMAALFGALDPAALDRFAITVGVPGALALLGLLAVVWLAPNSEQLLSDHQPALGLDRFRDRSPALRWRPTPRWAAFALGCLLPALYAILVEGHEEFIYRFF